MCCVMLYKLRYQSLYVYTNDNGWTVVVIEYIFAWPGLGQLSLKAILEHDFPVIQAYVLIVSGIIYCI